jgi:hypothetical protein
MPNTPPKQNAQPLSSNGSPAGNSRVDRLLAVLWRALVLAFTTIVALFFTILVFAVLSVRACADAPPLDPCNSADAPPRGETDRILCGLPAAYVAFTAPPELELDEPAYIGAVLHRELRWRELEDVLEAKLGRLSSPIDTATIRAANRMGARLEGQGFEITPSGTFIRAVGSADTVAWSWQVTPRRRGEQLLTLSIDAYIDVEGKETPRAFTVLERRIPIRVGFVGWLDLAAKWLVARWPLIAAFGVAVGGCWAAVRARVRARKRGPIGFGQ